MSVTLTTAEADRSAPGSRPSEDHEAIGRLAAGIARDLQLVARGVLGRAALAMVDPGRRPSSLEEVERTQEEVEAAVEVLQKLLYFAGDAATLPVTVPVSTLLKGIEEEHGREKPGVTVSVSLGPETVPVRVPPTSMRWAVDVLIENALEATPEGGFVFVTVRTPAVPPPETPDGPETPGGIGDPRRYACIEVADTGVGMEPEMVERAFEPYFSTRWPTPGRGLGLAAVRAIVRRSGGRIGLESSPRRGTRARIFLPMAQSPT